jgi:hypothetical protein
MHFNSFFDDIGMITVDDNLPFVKLQAKASDNRLKSSKLMSQSHSAGFSEAPALNKAQQSLLRMRDRNSREFPATRIKREIVENFLSSFEARMNETIHHRNRQIYKDLKHFLTPKSETQYEVSNVFGARPVKQPDGTTKMGLPIRCLDG